MPFDDTEREFVAKARVGRLATVDETGQPHLVPLCYTLVDDEIVSAIDAKPKRVGPARLRRVRNIRERSAVSMLVDRYEDDWAALGWVRVDGAARIAAPEDTRHGPAVEALRAKYGQYADHPLDERPVIVISPDRVQSWGAIDAPP